MTNLLKKMRVLFHRNYNKFLLKNLQTNKKPNESLTSNQKLFISILILGVLAFIWDKNRGGAPTTSEENRKSVDTFIPAGFVLVPIQLSNAEALDSMISSTGVVDLFIPDLKRPGHNKKIAEHIKILRAPLNPNQFAVLVSEHHSARLVHHEGAYFAVVQNPKTGGTQFEMNPPKKRLSRLIMEDVHEFK